MEAAGDLERRTGQSALRRIFPSFLINEAGLFIVLAVVAAVITLGVRLSDLGRGFGGYASFSEPGQSWARPSYFTPKWWPIYEVHSDPMKLRLWRINGLPYTDNARDEYERAAAAGEQTVTVEATYLDEPLTLDIPVSRITLRDLTDVFVADAITGLVFLLLAIEVLRARPSHELNRVFAIACSVAAANRFGAGTSLFEDSRPASMLALTLAVLSGCFVGWALYRFATLYPSANERMRRLWRPLWIVTCLNAVATALVWGFWPPFLPQGLREQITLIYPLITIGLYAVGLPALALRVIWSLVYQRETRRERRSAFIIGLGLLAAMPMLIRMALVSIPGQDSLDWWFLRGADLRYLFLAVPISFAYVILRYQTFRSPSQLFMFVLVLSFSAFVAALGVWGWDLTRPADAAPARPPFFGLFAIVLLTAGLWSAQAGRVGWFGRFLNWERQSYDAARSFGRCVMKSTGADLVGLPQVIADALIAELKLEPAAVWLWNETEGVYQLVGWAGAPGALPAELQRLIGPGLAGPPHHVGEDAITAHAQKPLRAAGIEVIVPLRAKGIALGLLGLGKRWDEAIFDERDMAIAELVGQQATLFLMAGQQVEQLRRVPKQITQAQEHERLSLARELHDTTQQFLGRLPFFLAISKMKVSAEPEVAAQMLDQAIDDAGDAAAELRRIRVNLAPNMLEVRLARPIEDLVAYVEMRSGLALNLTLPPGLDGATTPDTRHALYRVIQQALDNILNHAEASRVDVTIRKEAGRLLLEVRDDGRGMSEDAVRAAKARGSFGLTSMQTRLEAVGGEFRIESAEGEGTTIYGWVPAAAIESASSAAIRREPSGVKWTGVSVNSSGGMASHKST